MTGHKIIEQIDRLLDIGITLSNGEKTDTLLRKILPAAKSITTADYGTLCQKKKLNNLIDTNMTDTLHLSTPSCGDDHDPAAIPAEIARQRILDAVTPLAETETERLPLLQSLDRVLSEPVIAGINVPPHDNSAMDGYALNAGELPGNGTRDLRVIGDSFAGHPFNAACGRGECVRIMTGAVIPAGTDTVIPQEHVEMLNEQTIRIDGRTRPGENVRQAGEDLMLGQTVLDKGRRITAADLGLLASLGISAIPVLRRLRVAFFTTGDELRGVGEALRPGEIHDSNRYTLFGMLTHQHCLISDLGVVGDDPQALRAALKAAAKEHDVIISTGGVSVGAADHVRSALSELGHIDFWKVAMKPGRPLTFGHVQQAWFFGLPGNPVAAMVSFCQFVQPALQRLAGETANPPLSLHATTTSTLKKRAGRTEYQRGILSLAEDGSMQVRKTGEQGSGILLSMSRANCFIVLSAEQTHVEPGAQVMVQPFAGFL